MLQPPGKQASEAAQAAALQALLQANGLGEEEEGDGAAGGPAVSELEMFLHDYPRMLALDRFPALKTLKLICQGIERIEGLGGCPLLERLWLQENRIAAIEGLGCCPHLVELYLHSNRITAITGLEQLTGLQVLWLADNYVASLDGLSALAGLRQLHLARNNIAAVGSGLAANTDLMALNLAGNPICSFQDVARLSSLPRLRDLCLSDPFWGASPVASLCNYQTFALAALPRLTALDTLLLAEETKVAAAATLAKKQLFYSTRARALRHSVADLVDRARAACQASRWAELGARLSCAAKSLERQQQQQLAGPSSGQLLDQLRSAAMAAAGRQAALEARLDADVAAAGASLQDAVSWLQHELSSGGNVRLEEAQPGDQPLASCQELLRRARGGGAGVRVLSAARVHNRQLRWRFERLQREAAATAAAAPAVGAGAAVASGGPEAAAVVPRTELLLYGEHPALPGELLRAARQGFRPPAEYASLGLDGAVRLADCAELADQPRLQQAQAEAQGGAAASQAPGPAGCLGGQQQRAARQGRLLVCRVLLAGPSQEAGGAVGIPGGTRRQAEPSSWLDGPRIEKQAFPGAAAVWRAAAVARPPAATATLRLPVGRQQQLQQQQQQQQQQRRVWYVFDGAAVLPELLVTFEHGAVEPGPLPAAAEAKPTAAGASPEAEQLPGAAAGGDLSLGGGESADDGRSAAGGCGDPLLPLCAQPLLAWLPPPERPEQQGLAAAAAASDLQGRAAAGDELELECEALLAAAAAAGRPDPQLRQPLAAALSQLVGCRQLSSLERLSLHHSGLSSCVGLLALLPRVTSLVLSCNQLSSLEGLGPAQAPAAAGGGGQPAASPGGGVAAAGGGGSSFSPSSPSSCSSPSPCCSQLASLDVSFNCIASWSGSWLAGCPGLAALDASHNLLAEAQQLGQQLAGSAPRLRCLNVRANPLRQHGARRRHLLAAALPRLEELDGELLARPGPGDGVLLSDAALREGAARWHSGSGAAAEQPPPEAEGGGAAAWGQLVHTVVLDGHALRGLEGLEVAGALVAASLADNLLASAAGLQGCTALQDVNLSGNLLTDLAPLSALRALRSLDAADNQVVELAALSLLTALSRLCVERNRVAILQPLSGLSALAELYVANNEVADIKEAERLAALPRLAALDLSGNPLATATEDYRLLLLYRLRQLRVLDGAPAGAVELAAARAKFSGRLTLSFLEEQLGPSQSPSSVRSLDISGLRIRDLGNAFAPGGPFAGLAELLLQANAVSSLAPLHGLTALSVLRLGCNRLGEAEPAAVSFGVAAAGGSGTAAAPRPLLPALRELHLDGNRLSSLRPLALRYAPALRRLFVQGNELQRLEGLEGLGQLQELVADRNKIRVLEGEALACVPRLRELRLQDNAIRALALAPPPGSDCSGACGGWRPQAGLEVLLLSGNRLADSRELAALSALGGLLEVSLSGNPVARKLGYRQQLVAQCPQLQVVDGQQVGEEERSFAATEMLGQQPEDEEQQQRPLLLRLPPPLGDIAGGVLLAAAAAPTPGRRTTAGWPLLSLVAAGGPPGSRGGGSSAAALATGRSAGGSAPAGRAQAQSGGAAVGQQVAGAVAAAAAALAGQGQGPQLGPRPVLSLSVPSIQCGVLTLSGPAAFGLQGTAIGSGGGGGGGGAGQPRPASGKQRAGADAGSPSAARRTTVGAAGSGGWAAVAAARGPAGRYRGC